MDYPANRFANRGTDEYGRDRWMHLGRGANNKDMAFAAYVCGD